MNTAAVDTRAGRAATGRGLPSPLSAVECPGFALAAGAFLPGLLAIVFGSVIAVRRLTGAAPVPPGPAAVLLSGAVGILLVWLADLASRPAAAARGAVPLAATLARLGLLMSVAAVSLPPRWSVPGDVVAVVATAACVAATMLLRLPHGLPAHWPRLRQIGWRPAWQLPDRAVAAPAVSTGSVTGRAADAPVGATIDDGPAGAGCLVQRFERHALADGSECVRGRLHVAVAAGARSGAGHVGFCPPLSCAPTIQVSTDYDAVEAIVTAAEVLPWGARIECRLDEPAEEAIEIPVDLLARTPA